QDLRNYLGGFAFPGDMASTSIATFSGGEKARLALALIVWQRPNLLLLDEPTNHLDLDTREALTVALAQFEGTLVLVSHDRHLLRATTDQFLIVAKGRLAPFDGDLEDYRDWLFRTKLAPAEAVPLPEAEKPVAAAPPVASTRRGQKRKEAEERTLPRSFLTSPRRVLPSRRFLCELRVGRVGLRWRGTTAARATSSCRRTSASSRLRSRLRCCCDLMTRTPSRVMRWSREARSRDLTCSGSEEARMSKRRCTAEETLLTFWPPAPCARIALSSISDSGIAIAEE